MSPKGSVVESIYSAIKTEVSSGDLLPGHRVDIAGLCARFRVSKSPIRNILNRLVGERLLETHAHDGFFRPWLTEQKLRDLYQWSQDIILLAMDRAASVPLVPVTMTDDGAVLQLEAIFTQLVAQAGNAEYNYAIDNANARLRPIRLQKPARLFDLEKEIQELNAAIIAQDRDLVRTQIDIYHQRRIDAVPQIVAGAYK